MKGVHICEKLMVEIIQKALYGLYSRAHKIGVVVIEPYNDYEFIINVNSEQISFTSPDAGTTVETVVQGMVNAAAGLAAAEVVKSTQEGRFTITAKSANQRLVVTTPKPDKSSPFLIATLEEGTSGVSVVLANRGVPPPPSPAIIIETVFLSAAGRPETRSIYTEENAVVSQTDFIGVAQINIDVLDLRGLEIAEYLRIALQTWKMVYYASEKGVSIQSIEPIQSLPTLTDADVVNRHRVSCTVQYAYRLETEEDGWIETVIPAGEIE